MLPYTAERAVRIAGDRLRGVVDQGSPPFSSFGSVITAVWLREAEIFHRSWRVG